MVDRTDTPGTVVKESLGQLIDAAQAEDGLRSLVQFVVVVIERDRRYRATDERDVLQQQVGAPKRVIGEADLTERIGSRSQGAVSVISRRVGFDDGAGQVVKPIGTAGQVGRIDDHSRDSAQSVGGSGGQAVVLPSALELTFTSADGVGGVHHGAIATVN